MTSSSITPLPSMTINASAFQGEFAQRVKETISQSLFGLIPDEQLLLMINGEIKAFFETEDYVVLTKIDNPKAPKNPSYYDNTPKQLDAFSFKMTPFRQLCWVTIFDLLQDKIIEVVKHDFEDKENDLNKWFDTICSENIKQANDLNFNQLSIAMAHSQHLATMKAAITLSIDYAHMSLSSVRSNPNGSNSGFIGYPNKDTMLSMFKTNLNTL